MTAHQYCKSVLKKVSRTFAINIAFLRGDLYKAILCAYLFCRIADTIEDTVFEDREEQIKLLEEYRNIFAKQDFTERKIENWVSAYVAAFKIENSVSEDHKLVLNTQRVVENFMILSTAYRDAICDCIVEMAEGMLATISTKRQKHGRVYFSKTIAELNQYCYYVAGTVGILLTRLFAVHAKSITGRIIQALDRNSVSFGLGLQMTNIVKDCWTDYKRGWCYIPQEMAQKNGLAIENLFEPRYKEQAQNTLNDLINRAAKHLDDALAYTLHIPRRNYRIRLFCSLPLFFAINTLLEAKDNLRLLAGEKVKISRRRVRKIIGSIQVLCLSNRALARYYQSFRIQLRP